MKKNDVFLCRFNPGYFFRVVEIIYQKNNKNKLVEFAVKFIDLQTNRVHSQTINAFNSGFFKKKHA